MDENKIKQMLICSEDLRAKRLYRCAKNAMIYKVDRAVFHVMMVEAFGIGDADRALKYYDEMVNPDDQGMSEYLWR